MDPSIVKKIIEYGKKRDVASLQNLIQTISEDDIKSLIERQFSDPLFISLWNYLLYAFDGSEESCRKYYELSIYALHQLDNVHIPNLHMKNIIAELSKVLPKFKTNYLLKLASFCIQCIQVGNIINMSWMDLLPKLLNIISDRDIVYYNDITYTGSEYKTEVVNSLCMMEWSSNIITSLAVMFIDVSLTKDEHYKVVVKLLQHVESLTCTELPGFIHNMLKLCEHLHSKCIFFKLQEYFHIRIYSCYMNESDMDSLELIESVPEPAALEAEATILFHIHQSAHWGNESIKDYLNCLKNLTNASEFILHPFQITVLLTISNATHYEDVVFDIIKSSVSRTLKEEEKKNESSWFQEILHHTLDINQIFQQVIHFTVHEKETYLKQGLINLGFVFLGAHSGFGKDVIAEKQWNLGLNLLLEVIKINRINSRFIIHKLCNCILTNQNITPYTDCLALLCKKRAFIILQNQNCIIELMESLIQMSGKIGIQVLEAISPLTKVSSTIKDQLILLLRKALFSRTIDTRQVAVSGFILLLKNTKIVDPLALSQLSGSSSSSRSLLTQISLSRTSRLQNNTLTNESLCLEILNILRRCFMQQSEVRIHLYEGLYDAVSDNPQLTIPILTLLLQHFISFYESDVATLPPLNFSSVTLRKDVDVILQEPLGKLIQLIGSLLARTNVNEESNIRAQFCNILDQLCERMPKCELVHFKLDDGTDLLDSSPDAIQKGFILKEAMAVYDALIDYKLNSWSMQSQNTAEQINLLFLSYNRLLQFSKNLKKSKKIDKKKSDNDKNVTTSTDVTLSSKKSSFKPRYTQLHSNSLIKALEVLHLTEVNWTTEDLTILKSKKEFHQYILQTTLNYIEFTKHCTKTQKAIRNNSCVQMANILYNRCLIRFNEFSEFDSTTALLAIDAFYNITQLMFVKSQDVVAFVNAINDSEEEANVLLSKFAEVFIGLFEENASLGDDSEVKKVSLICINILSLLISKVPKNNIALFRKVLDFLKNHAKQNVLSNKPIVLSFTTLLFNLNLKFKTTTSIFENVAKNLSKILGTITTEHECTEEFNSITETTASVFLQALCHSIKTNLDDVDWIISRMKAECIITTYPGGQNTEKKIDSLKQKERAVCCHMCWIINIANILSDLKLPSQSEYVIKCLTHIFNTMDSLAKYFILSSTKDNLRFEDARFDRVIKVVGKQLSKTVYSLILSIDENQTSQETNTQNKKQANSLKNKILRETKLIPKLVYEIEQFSKTVIQLSSKTKVDLTKYVGQGTARDFRILNVEDILRNANETTELDVSVTSKDDSITESNIASEEENSSTSLSKRRRLS